MEMHTHIHTHTHTHTPPVSLSCLFVFSLCVTDVNQTSIVELPGGEEEDSFPSQPLYIKLEQKAYEGATLAPPVGAAEESICAQFCEATPIRYWILFALIFIPNRDVRGVYGSRFVSRY